jgi:hypothetical protein
MKFRGITPVSAAGLLLMIGIDLWLGIVIAVELLSETATAGKVEWNANLAASADGVAKPKPIDAYREIVAHPVFSKSRAPFVAPPPPAPVAVAPPPPPAPIDPGLTIGGVMIKGGFKTVYVLGRGANNGIWVREGEIYMGWKVVVVNKAGAKLEQGGRSIDLLLYPER